MVITREKERKKKKIDVRVECQSDASCTSHYRDQARNPGMHPDLESNQTSNHLGHGTNWATSARAVAIISFIISVLFFHFLIHMCHI